MLLGKRAGSHKPRTQLLAREKGLLLQLLSKRSFFIISVPLVMIDPSFICLQRVYTRQGAGNVFFLSDRPLVVGQFKSKLRCRGRAGGGGGGKGIEVTYSYSDLS